METKLVDAVRSVASKYGLRVRATTDGIQLSKPEWVTTINLEPHGEDVAVIYLYTRTSSWDLPGERTDANDLMSVLLAAFMRCGSENFSPMLWDVGNPAIWAPETEVYARILTLEQPHNSVVRTYDGSFSDLVAVCQQLDDFHHLFPRLFTWEHGNEQGYSFEGDVATWATNVAQALREPLDDNIQFNRRWSPDWLFYRSIRRRMSVIRSNRTVAVLQATGADGPGQVVPGINRSLFVSSRVRSTVSIRVTALAKTVLQRLNGHKLDCITVIPLENKVVCAGGAYIVVMSHKCGLHEFKKESSRVAKRHRREAALLFPPTKYEWSVKLDDDRFEQLVQDLLLREPGVLRVRKVGRSRDADRGKDLIVDWMTPPFPERPVQQDSAPTVLRKVLVQAKASSKSVNKGAVRDIRDTMDGHDASGYFLAVSSQITSDLTDHLDRMRSEGTYWADWWNRREIEERLNTNPDIALRYSDLINRID